jgi:transposase InsO family protein
MERDILKKSGGLLRQGPRLKFAFIQVEKAAFSVTVACRVLGVSRSGFYAGRTRPVAARVTEDARLAVQIAAIHRASRRCYGCRRVHAELRAHGHCTSRKRVARLMRHAGLAARRRRAFRVTTQSRHTRAVAPNRLARQFTVPAPNRVWVTDITYLATVEGWLYLAVVLDLFSRRVVGWATSDRLGEGVALEALGMGVARRRPRPDLLHHSDRGSEPAFNWSSQHCLCEPIVERHRAPRPVFASRGSFAAWC